MYEPLDEGVDTGGRVQLKIPRVVGMLSDVGMFREVGIFSELASPRAWEVRALLRAVLESPRDAAENEGMGRLVLLNEEGRLVVNEVGRLVVNEVGRLVANEVGRLTGMLLISVFICKGSSRAAITWTCNR